MKVNGRKVRFFLRGQKGWGFFFRFGQRTTTPAFVGTGLTDMEVGGNGVAGPQIGWMDRGKRPARTKATKKKKKASFFISSLSLCFSSMRERLAMVRSSSKKVRIVSGMDTGMSSAAASLVRLFCLWFVWVRKNLIFCSCFFPFLFRIKKLEEGRRGAKERTTEIEK